MGGVNTPPKKFFLKNIYFGGGNYPPQNGLGGVNTPPKIVGGAYGTPKVGVIFFWGGYCSKNFGGAYGTPKIVWGCQMAHYPPPWTPMEDMEKNVKI